MDKLLFGPDVPFPESRGLPTFFSPSMAGKYSPKCKSASKLVRMLSTLSCFLLLKPVTKACLTMSFVSFVCHLCVICSSSLALLGSWGPGRLAGSKVKMWPSVSSFDFLTSYNILKPLPDLPGHYHTDEGHEDS